MKTHSILKSKKLKLQDEAGNWHRLGKEDGEWYVFDGDEWIKAEDKISAEENRVLEVSPQISESIEVDGHELTILDVFDEDDISYSGEPLTPEFREATKNVDYPKGFEPPIQSDASKLFNDEDPRTYQVAVEGSKSYFEDYNKAREKEVEKRKFALSESPVSNSVRNENIKTLKIRGEMPKTPQGADILKIMTKTVIKASTKAAKKAMTEQKIESKPKSILQEKPNEKPNEKSEKKPTS